MSARYQNPMTSRWMSADPAGASLINPMDQDGNLRSGFSIAESQNWYSYCGNNPVMYSDPTGLEWEETDNGYKATEGSDYLAEISEDAGYDSWQDCADANAMGDFYDDDGNWGGGDFTLEGITILDKETTDGMKNESTIIPEGIDNQSYRDAFSSYFQKKPGDSLTQKEDTVQNALGVGEMIGGVGLFGGSCYLARPDGVLLSTYIFADGGNRVGTNGKKAKTLILDFTLKGASYGPASSYSYYGAKF